ncbi:ATP-binding cassette domain-containing protein [Staphylococcus lugdunensis]|uniref:ATP-binding cassette domain-containing protein n=1 Tax=Staphylococcus lugdunensis TaxID=28035 RepID=UPI000A103949|nr:ATP-binding cassette domain-containing protein [Staphylococcus lugdunensis]ARJ26143.1 ABC transporter ATP-binding protein [Staphylococcus lugdunensis]MCH8673527.1 ATP-binding cassette domain-containing protein [Staphylococcus lugdunensis]MCI2762506.1 ATP-binding cassette domain-containing protein [Staphylococcus lugdunensis]MCI2805879.1 ATP-binding cassette domain-containing protein [Staphylococcus lugdunensis]MCI2813588.1 ATP-binding cassette domain-containing protein [Staphylococcus lugdu
MESLMTIKDLKVDINNRKILNLNNSTINIYSEDKIALIGKNGAGKTTLINCLLNEINYSGVIDRKISSKDIGIVFQENKYGDLIKVHELIYLATAYSKRSEQFKAFTKAFSLEHLINKFVKDLSLGEQKRLTVGLVLNKQKKLYIFDELTSGLDYEKRQNLLQKTKEITQNKAVIKITHYFDEVENWANKLIILDKGELLYYGSIDQFFSKFYHYALIEIVNQELDHLVKDDIEKINADVYFNAKIVTHNKEQMNDVINILNERKIEFKINMQNIYSTYLISTLEEI